MALPASLAVSGADGSGAAAHARRGRLTVVVEEVQGGAGASRLPKYVTVRLNRARVGKTRSQLGCLYHHALSPMDNVSADDILVVSPPGPGCNAGSFRTHTGVP